MNFSYTQPSLRRHWLASAVAIAFLPLAVAASANPAESIEAVSASVLCVRAPLSLSGLDLNLQIEKVSPATALPNQGVIVKRYLARGQWSSQGAGGTGHQVRSGNYQLRHSGHNSLEERSTEVGGQGSSTTRYQFDSANSGTWVQTAENGQQLSGRFSTAPSQASASQMLAPATNAGLHVALVIKNALAPTLPPGVYPSAGLVLQSYAADGTLTLQGFGPGNINSKGTYSYRRMSANTAVEETWQTSDFFTYPYTMVYTFKTPHSGTWYQNFANSLIQFSGTFDTFPR